MGRERERDLALASIAVIEPLQKAILVDVLDASATRTRETEWVIGVTRVPADSAHVLLLVLLLKSRRQGHRRFALHTSKRRRNIRRRRGGRRRFDTITASSRRRLRGDLHVDGSSPRSGLTRRV